MSEPTNKVVVTLKIGVDVDAFIEEMSTHGNVSPHVPERAVEIFNLKPESLRNVDFTMTRAEMEELKKDERVIDCRWGTKAENGIVIKLHGTQQVNAVRAPTYISPYDNNWALVDCRTPNNVFTSNTVNAPTTYTLDGTGVDIVIQDTGIQINHPEFQDANGNSRVKKIDWWVEAGNSSDSRPWTPNILDANMPAGFYQDTFGHGTNVASIAAGKTYGWAKNANIYVMKIFDTGALACERSFQLIRQWHQRKISQGINRPTIVNMSWGTSVNVSLSDLQNKTIVYRGTTITTTSSTTVENLQQYGIFPVGDQPDDGNHNNDGEQSIASTPAVLASLTAEAADCINAGVILVGAAGNESYKIDVTGGVDYDNKLTIGGVDYYYHRGSTPTALNISQSDILPTPLSGNDPSINADVVCVGAIDYTKGGSGTYVQSNSTAKASFSNSGPRVDVYAPGGMIAGATCNSKTIDPSGTIDGYPVTSYYGDSQFKQQKESGTSQASPQVTGVLACVLQKNPTYTQKEVQQWIRDNSVFGKIYDEGPNSYTNLYSLQGSDNRYLYFPYRDVKYSVSGAGSFSGGVSF
jgi:hypothetical protein